MALTTILAKITNKNNIDVFVYGTLKEKGDFKEVTGRWLGSSK